MVRPESLAELTANEVTDYFESVARGGRLQDRRFRQPVDVIRLLLVDLANVGCSKEIDWDDWAEGGHARERDHPTTASERPPEARTQDRAAQSRFARSAAAFPSLATLARTLRVRHYSIGTEQSYVDWCHRFFLFCQAKRPVNLGAENRSRKVTTRPYRKKPLWVVCGGSVFGMDAKAKPTGMYSRRLPEQTTHRGPSRYPEKLKIDGLERANR